MGPKARYVEPQNGPENIITKAFTKERHGIPSHSGSAPNTEEAKKDADVGLEDTIKDFDKMFIGG